MNKIANHTALKEWASAITALGAGQQILLIRKGGIADPTFGVEADRFYLFPTYFHEEVATAAPSTVPIRHWAEVVTTWRVEQFDLLARLLPHVVFTQKNLEDRYRFRPDQAAHVIAVRTWLLPQSTEIAMKQEYAGCRSLVSLDDEIDIDGSTRALDEPTLQAKIAEIAHLLQPTR